MPSNPPLSRQSSPARAALDVKKFTVTFACDRVGREVEFGWTEAVPNAEAAGDSLKLEAVVCSGRASPGCPVRQNSDGTVCWDQCPRMQRLAARLRRAQLLVSAPRQPGAAVT